MRARRTSSPEAYARIDEHVRRPAGAGRPTSTRASPRPTAALRREQGRRRGAAPARGTTTRSGRTPSPGRHAVPHDLPRIAIIVDGAETDCYAALGAVHSTWRPVPGRFKDFIASPKNNLYRSLHTTVIGPDGRTVEVLIRTEAMHRDAEYGIAADFRFPAEPGAQRPRLGRGGPAPSSSTGCAGCSTGEQDAADPAQFLESLRCDLAEGQIQVFADGQPAAAAGRRHPGRRGLRARHRRRRPVRRPRRSTASSPRSPRRWPTATWWRSSPRPTASRRARRRAGGPSPRVARASSSRPHAQLQIEPLVRRAADEPRHHASPTRSGSAGPRSGWRCASTTAAWPATCRCSRLADELGYPDLETLLVAVADHGRPPDDGGRPAHRPGRPRAE